MIFDELPVDILDVIRANPAAVGLAGAKALANAAAKSPVAARRILEEHVAQSASDLTETSLIKALATPIAPSASKASLKHDFKQGKKKLGSLEAKLGLVVYRFPNADEATTERWFNAFLEFIEKRGIK
jgi:hypothetical protein